MSYSAVILAGGEGTRLKPLSLDIPKPLFPVAGEENIRRTAELLCASGFDNAIVCVRYKKEQIISALGDCCHGLNLKYYIEDEPLGTAGAVRAALSDLDSDFIVISADIVCDFDLGAAFEFHRKASADVTVITRRETSPMGFGIVMCASDGRVVKFTEKPGWEQVFSDTVNTGIYIISRHVMNKVPEGKFYDFSRDLFAQLLSDGSRMFGYECPGYWRDIGTFNDYLACNMDALDGKINLAIPKIRDSSLIHSIAGENYSHADGVRTVNSVLFDGVSVGADTVLEDCIIANGAFIGGGCSLHGCIVSENCVIPAQTSAQRKIFVKDGTEMDFLNKSRAFFDGTVTLGLGAGELGDICSCGAAAAQTVSGRLGVIYSEKAGAKASSAAELFIRGACLYGANVCDFGVGDEHFASIAGRYFGCETTALIEQHDNLSDCIKLRFFDKNGLLQTRIFEKAFTENYSSDSPPSVKPGSVQRINGLPELYCAALAATGKLDGIVIGLNHMRDPSQVKAALEAAGATVCMANTLYEYKEYYFINTASSGTVLCDSEGEYFDMYKCLLAVLTLSDKEALPVVALPYTAPRALSRAAEKNGIEVMYYLTRPSCEQAYDSKAREICGSLPFLRDPLLCAVKLIVMLKRLGITMSECRKRCEPIHIKTSYVSVAPESKAAVLRALYEDYLPYQISAADGIQFKIKQAEGSIIAGDGQKLRLIVSAENEQFATDAVGEISEKIKKYKTE